ncbi:membrane protein insertase YidC [bacterium endosymbiont of Pedicinus badii]|uniref:membrane protein insertase YidC n=1 Tax=bacterium endosymbiont of Pedicinus badii TaxID=1719126 RepID=UPI0009B935E1|nr:membrane protein insertase YidC [bacterium endosymbiont of Pedicinus badii]OQM34069.1 hypothetical protein AOQ89_01790 [bacterium endosymbiont of Pedicinus badii]
MDSQRNFLFISLLLISFIIFNIWKEENSQKKHLQKFEEKKEDYKNEIVQKDGKKQYIFVSTNFLSTSINLFDGNIENATLNTYLDSIYSRKPFCLLEKNSNYAYYVKSGFLDSNGPLDRENNRFYLTKQEDLLQGSKKIKKIELVRKSKSGVLEKKIFTYLEGKFLINISHEIFNFSDKDVTVQLYNEIHQTTYPTQKTTNSSFFLQSYKGFAYSSDGNRYRKYDFKEAKKQNLYVQTFSGWISVIQKYFLTAWIPKYPEEKIFYTKNFGKFSIIGSKTYPIEIKKNTFKKFSTNLWIGPEVQEELSKVAPNLDLTIDYGWLWFICNPLFKLLKFIHSYIKNWGFSIILITLIVRGLMYPLTKSQYISMAKIKMLQPKLLEIKEKFPDNRQKQSEQIMNLYRKEKVNPLGGCFPILVQMPIFLSLYYMLSGSIELRHSKFIFWILDLSSKDPYYILPIIMGCTMFLVQKISSSYKEEKSIDPIQKNIANMIPIVFTVFFLWFPSGLVLYYIVSNLVTILQQKAIYRVLNKNKNK